jgi:hypothetical protein
LPHATPQVLGVQEAHWPSVKTLPGGQAVQLWAFEHLAQELAQLLHTPLLAKVPSGQLDTQTPSAATKPFPQALQLVASLQARQSFPHGLQTPAAL